MPKGFRMLVLALVAAVAVPAAACADEPIKWSAPLSAYPSQWASSTPPPAYANQYADQYPYWGAYRGYQPYTGAVPSWQPAYAPGFSGNPYMRPYAP